MTERSGPPLVARRSRPRPSKLYPLIWGFAFKRQLVYLQRVSGEAGPWTDDPVLAAYRFTNAFRAADRVSQYLIRLAYADEHASLDTLFLRTILFKIFNRIDTWDDIVRKLGPPVAHRFDYAACDDLLAFRRTRAPIYSAAYIMPSGGRSGTPKHRMHLRLIRDMVADDLPAKLAGTRSLRDAYTLLRAWPTLGPFLAFQYAVDFNYTTLMSHPEHSFVVAGPGALDGLVKCFESLGDFTPAENHRMADRHAGGGVRSLRIVLQRSVGPAVAADRRPECALRGFQVHPGHASGCQGTFRADSHQAAFHRGRCLAEAVLSAEVGVEQTYRGVVRYQWHYERALTRGSTGSSIVCFRLGAAYRRSRLSRSTVTVPPQLSRRARKTR